VLPTLRAEGAGGEVTSKGPWHEYHYGCGNCGEAITAWISCEAGELGRAASRERPSIDVERLALAMMNTLPDTMDWEMQADEIVTEYARLASDSNPGLTDEEPAA
jgi:hypothetical protein